MRVTEATVGAAASWERRPVSSDASGESRFLGEAADEAVVADRVAAGALVGVGFGNFYALVASPGIGVVRAANVLKGRPPDQVGSVVSTPLRIPALFDWSGLPAELSRHAVIELMDALLAHGPFGFRGPASEVIEDHLGHQDHGVRTVQVIAPGHACPSNAFVRSCLERTGGDVLYITSANRSHHLTGAPDEPAHYRGDALAAEFGSGSELPLLRHRDEQQARLRHPAHAPLSTTLLAFHRTEGRDARGRVRLLVERHGSLPVEAVRGVVQPLGFDIVLAPTARARLAQRVYPD